MCIEEKTSICILTITVFLDILYRVFRPVIYHQRPLYHGMIILWYFFYYPDFQPVKYPLMLLYAGSHINAGGFNGGMA